MLAQSKSAKKEQKCCTAVVNSNLEQQAKNESKKRKLKDFHSCT